MATTSQRGALNRTTVLEAAIAFADAHGLKPLSMRKLAAELGYEVMSLYNHVANKDEILEGMTDLIAAEIDLGDLDDMGEWRDSMRAMAISAREMFSRHPWGSELWWNRMPGEHRLALMEWTLSCMRRAGFAPEVTYHAFHAVSLHVIGFTIQEQSFDDRSPEEEAAMATGFVAGLDRDRFANMIEHVEQHFDDHDYGDEYLFVLDLILDSLERLRTA